VLKKPGRLNTITIPIRTGLRIVCGIILQISVLF
jgi:hypothetical protein